jgi:hypothetical protein
MVRGVSMCMAVLMVLLGVEGRKKRREREAGDEVGRQPSLS